VVHVVLVVAGWQVLTLTQPAATVSETREDDEREDYVAGNR
jgi:hypothetical protein